MKFNLLLLLFMSLTSSCASINAKRTIANSSPTSDTVESPEFITLQNKLAELNTKNITNLVESFKGDSKHRISFSKIYNDNLLVEISLKIHRYIIGMQMKFYADPEGLIQFKADVMGLQRNIFDKRISDLTELLDQSFIDKYEKTTIIEFIKLANAKRKE